MKRLLRSLTVRIIVGIIMPCSFYSTTYAPTSTSPVQSPVIPPAPVYVPELIGAAPVNTYKNDLDTRLKILRGLPQALRDQRDKIRTYFIDLKTKREDLRKEIKKALDDYKTSIAMVRTQIQTLQKELLGSAGSAGIIQKFKDNAKYTDEVELADKLKSSLSEEIRNAENALSNFGNLEAPKDINN